MVVGPAGHDAQTGLRERGRENRRVRPDLLGVGLELWGRGLLEGAFKEAATPEFKAYAKQIRTNAAVLAAALTKAGLRVVSGGTDNHLMLVDVRPVELTGKAAEKLLDAVGITVNKNTIPYDPQKAGTASGIRIGTPAITTRGMKEAEMEHIGALIARALREAKDEAIAKQISDEVLDLTRRFPVPGITRLTRETARA